MTYILQIYFAFTSSANNVVFKICIFCTHYLTLLRLSAIFLSFRALRLSYIIVNSKNCCRCRSDILFLIFFLGSNSS